MAEVSITPQVPTEGRQVAGRRTVDRVRKARSQRLPLRKGMTAAGKTQAALAAAVVAAAAARV